MTKPRRPSPRARRRATPASGLSPRELIGMGVIWLLITAGAVFFVLPVIAQQTADEAALKGRGVSTEADALRVWSTPGGRGGPAYHLAFRFTPRGRTAAMVDEAYVSAREAGAVRIPAAVPIVYDPQRVELAQLNIGDKVHRRRPRLEGAAWSALVVVLIAAMWAALAVFTRDAFRERRASRGG